MKVSRRSFLGTTGAGVAAATALPALDLALGQDALAQTPTAGAPSVPAAPSTEVTLNVNGEAHRLVVEDRWTLAEVLRDHLRLTGTRLGCDRSECGACTVLLDGKNVYSRFGPTAARSPPSKGSRKTASSIRSSKRSSSTMRRSAASARRDS
jgi:xanthine dehydrogenase YagT iron-sulfur-binding subunit